MNIARILIAFILTGLLAGESLSAAENDTLGQRQQQREAIAERWDLEIDNIRDAAIPGLFEVVIGSQVIYLSADGRFLLEGDIVDLESRENLTDKRRAQARKIAIDSFGEDNMIIFGGESPLHTITVFTDTDCSYCRKLHAEIAAINDLSIAVRYLLYPRYGPGSKSWQIANNVWCADDRQEALTQAKLNKTIEARQCVTPVMASYRLGQGIGFRGTPATITADGDLIAGYLPPQALLERLNQLAESHNSR
ncbi:MAG: DsbC family protein [Gammaproteobacteria bacterium]|nr:DsbC family protein [Gammaproteobacteria bacterium]